MFKSQKPGQIFMILKQKTNVFSVGKMSGIPYKYWLLTVVTLL